MLFAPEQLSGAIAYENLFLNPSFRLSRTQLFSRSAAVSWIYGGGNGTATTSIGSFTWNQTDVPNNPTNYLEMVQSVAATSANRANVGQRFESAGWNAGKTLTIAMWLWSSVNWSNFFFQASQLFGTGGSSNTNQNSPFFALTANTWQLCTYTFTLPSVASAILGSTTDYTQIRLLLGADTAGTLRVANAGLYLGSIVPPWQDRSPLIDRQMCSRYWQRAVCVFDGNVTSGTSYIASGLILPMRATPTLTATNAANTSFGATPSVSYQSSGGEAWIEDTRAATATGRGRIVSVIDCNAEL